MVRGSPAHGARDCGQIGPRSGRINAIVRPRSEREWKAWRERDAKLRKEEVAALGPRRFDSSREELFIGLAGSRGVATADRIDNQGRRYNVILMALRASHPTWKTETVRDEARRLLKAETWRAVR
jgi:hypothetical protein